MGCECTRSSDRCQPIARQAASLTERIELWHGPRRGHFRHHVALMRFAREGGENGPFDSAIVVFALAMPLFRLFPQLEALPAAVCKPSRELRWFEPNTCHR